MPKQNHQFQTIRTEGAILPPDVLRRIAALKVTGATAETYHLPPSSKVNEAVSQSWTTLLKHWQAFQDAHEKLLDSDETGTAVTNDRWLLPLFKELGYGRLITTKAPEIDGRIYPIERFYNHTPIHLIGCKLPLDRRTRGARGAATASPHSMVQEFLNCSDDHLWAFLSNGLHLRILRNNVSLSRQAFVEFDLEAMMEGEVYADFALLWLLCHQSRVEADKPEECWLEKWSKLAREQGTRVLNDLRIGVGKAIEALGSGFIAHPHNDRLRERLYSGELSKEEYYRQLLRIVYRLLFLFVAEDRELLHPPGASEEACDLYDAHYSTRRLRDLALKIRGSKHADLWHSLSLVFGALGKNEGCPQLGLGGLGSFLWRASSTADLLGPHQAANGELRIANGVRPAETPQHSPFSIHHPPVFITNDDLLKAIRELAYVEQGRVLRRVDYRNLGSEELGSVYESLLEMHPVMNIEAQSFELRTAAGNERKTTGSYYTPDSLVQCLLDSALDPVVEDRLKEARRAASSEWRMVNEPYRRYFIEYAHQRLSQPGTQSSKEGEWRVGGERIDEDASDKYHSQFTIHNSPDSELATLWQQTPFSVRHSLFAEQALLALKVCDPACGSGHFLIAAAHRLARHLARIRTKEAEPGPEDHQRALRDVIGHCLYGVDINPMAVELCKVSMWMEAMEPGKPLSFLDHHIKCGNSLLGTTPALLHRGIPDEAFKPIQGDDKEYCASFKKRNKNERSHRKEDTGEDLLFEETPPWEQMGNLASAIWRLDQVDDSDLEGIRRKERHYEEVVHSSGYLFGRLLADAWCAAFVWVKTKANVDRGLRPITEDLFRKIERNPHSTPYEHKKEIMRLAEEYRFFHWHLEYPDVFKPKPIQEIDSEEVTGLSGGFDVVLGNPPWESSDLVEKEFFAVSAPNIATARTKARRSALINDLCNSNPNLAKQWFKRNREHHGITCFIKNSYYFPLGSCGKLNTYRVFSELSTMLVGSSGRMGMVLKSGIINAQDSQQYIRMLLKSRRICSALDFINTKFLFSDVVGNERFCLFTATGTRGINLPAQYAFGLTSVEEIRDSKKLFFITPDELRIINPNDLSLPPLNSSHDKVLLLVIHQRLPPARIDNGNNGNPWNLKYTQGHLNSATGSVLFAEHTLEQLLTRGARWGECNKLYLNDSIFLPLYEGKFIAQMNHRFGTFEGVPIDRRFGTKAEARDLTVNELDDPHYEVMPRYWLLSTDAESLYNQKNTFHFWLFSFRDVCRAIVDARTVQACVLPRRPCLDGCPLLIFDLEETRNAQATLFFNSVWSSFVLDYVARQKIHGAHLTKAIAYQLPTPQPEVLTNSFFNGELWDFVYPRVLELTYVTYSLNPLATATGYFSPPFHWDEERRFLLRCELDAAYFHLYLGSAEEWGKEEQLANGESRMEKGVEGEDHSPFTNHHSPLIEMFPTPRHAVEYIMETFPIVKRKDEKAHGHYRTKDTILEIYDEMADAMRTGRPYQTRLDPPPGPPCDAEGNFISMAQWDPANWPKHIHLPKEAAVEEPEEILFEVFAGMAYPKTEADRAICAAALAIIEQSGGLSSMEHLDALLLTTHPEWCRTFLGDTDRQRFDAIVQSAPSSLFVSPGDSIHWKDCRDYLEKINGISVNRSSTDQPITPGTELTSTKAKLPQGVESVASYALKALDRIRELRRNLPSASQTQQRILATFDEQHKLYGVAA